MAALAWLLEFPRIFSSTCGLQFVQVFTENLAWKESRFGSRWQKHRVTETGAQWHRGTEAQGTIAHTWRHTKSENSVEPECTVHFCVCIKRLECLSSLYIPQELWRT